MSTWVILPILMLATLPFRADAAVNSAVGARPGYVFDVEKEKNQHDQELVLVEEPKPLPPLKDRLFDEKVTKDIQQEYQQRFGYTTMEQTMNAPQNREQGYTYQGDPTVTADQYQKYQRSFGEYISRKVFENQADHFMKDNDSLKGVYKVKDAVSNATIQTKSGYKVKYHYNLSGNTTDVALDNPYRVETKVTLQLGNFKKTEETLNMGYDINARYRVESYYKFEDGLFQVVGIRRITTSLSASVSGSQTTKAEGPSIRQSLMMVGISWTQ